MSITIVKQPKVAVNAEFSKWQAVHHPLEFHFQRKDSIVNIKYKQVNENVKMLIGSGIPATVIVGQSIRFVSIQQTFTSTILSINGSIIEVDNTTAGSVFGGFVLYLGAFSNYSIITEILAVDTSNVYNILGEMNTRGNVDGLVKINIQQWIKTKALYDNDFNYDVINKNVIGESGKYNLRVREAFNKNETAPETIIDLFYWTNSAKQIQELYGSNMGEYVPTVDGTRVNKAKFQSVFEKPTYFVGYPFSMNFIYSDNLKNLQITREERQLDINGALIGSQTSDNLNATQRGFGNRLMLAQGYGPTVKQVEVWLESGAAIPDDEIGNGVYTDGSVFGPYSVQSKSPTIPPQAPQVD